MLGDTLLGASNQFLNVDMYLQSANGCFNVIMQGDGNFVTYNAKTGTPIWHTNTANSAYRAVLYSVIYSQLSRNKHASAVGARKCGCPMGVYWDPGTFS